MSYSILETTHSHTNNLSLALGFSRIFFNRILFVRILVGWLVVWGLTSIWRSFSHISTWKQEITNLWKFKWRGRKSNPGPLAPKAKSLTTRPPLLPSEEKKEEIWLSPVTKTPTPTEQSKKQRDNIKTPPKTLITQLLRTDLGRSVGVTAVTQLVWLNRFTSAQPSH